MSSAWEESNCRIGLILGTGTNACYLEKISNIGTIDARKFPKEENMVINTEWGACGDNGELDFILTKWDRAIQEESLFPWKQTFEKMISDMYVGELIRHILVDLLKDDLIFSGCKKDEVRELFKKESFLTRFASEIESDPVGEYQSAAKCLMILGIHPSNVSEEDFSGLRYVCEVASRRAAFLASAGIAALLRKMDCKDVAIAIDGSLFRYHPYFRDVMKLRICQLMGTIYKFDLMLSEDGSGMGDCMVAAVLKTGDRMEEYP